MNLQNLKRISDDYASTKWAIKKGIKEGFENACGQPLPADYDVDSAFVNKVIKKIKSRSKKERMEGIAKSMLLQGYDPAYVAYLTKLPKKRVMVINTNIIMNIDDGVCNAYEQAVKNGVEKGVAIGEARDLKALP